MVGNAAAVSVRRLAATGQRTIWKIASESCCRRQVAISSPMQTPLAPEQKYLNKKKKQKPITVGVKALYKK